MCGVTFKVFYSDRPLAGRPRPEITGRVREGGVCKDGKREEEKKERLYKI